jgi:hypothetical protein
VSDARGMLDPGQDASQVFVVSFAASRLGDLMSDRRIQINNTLSLGGLWFAGWLFTIGYLKLDFWLGLMGIIVWPYFIGSHLAGPATP